VGVFNSQCRRHFLILQCLTKSASDYPVPAIVHALHLFPFSVNPRVRLIMLTSALHNFTKTFDEVEISTCMTLKPKKKLHGHVDSEQLRCEILSAVTD